LITTYSKLSATVTCNVIHTATVAKHERPVTTTTFSVNVYCSVQAQSFSAGQPAVSATDNNAIEDSRLRSGVQYILHLHSRGLWL